MNSGQSSASGSLLSSVSLGYTIEMSSSNRGSPWNGEEGLTSLGDDGASGDHNHRPVELALEVSNDLIADLAESGE